MQNNSGARRSKQASGSGLPLHVGVVVVGVVVDVLLVTVDVVVVVSVIVVVVVVVVPVFDVVVFEVVVFVRVVVVFVFVVLVLVVVVCVSIEAHGCKKPHGLCWGLENMHACCIETWKMGRRSEAEQRENHCPSSLKGKYKGKSKGCVRK